MFQEDDKLGKCPANLFIPRGQHARRHAGSMPVAARAACPSPRGQHARRHAGSMPSRPRPADKVALCIQGVHDDGDSYPTMRDG
ncbi:hypothetical protein ELG83_11520 [Rhizobium leguminosarum]|nr:hypothetical protein ELG92_12320 [Rhizobium leguminosarum]TBF52336.1 hypothetical protein ELG91_11520 [Rhizobium leguminosarum]TBF57038.1 hypothetical protein ELG87_11685 [Rhizobium leguminosarum]TBF61707.1 hypothetical protein ELG90_11510 [Rhizobium leguminosarum]TBF73431.1 hypothetical protein ELG84_11445 [Rhizobium leguminosarum]